MQSSIGLALGPLVFWFCTLTVKHVVADFPMQGRWMALGKEKRHGWLAPLAAHCAVHGILTTILISLVEPRLWFLGAIDFALHFGVDRSKSLCMRALRVSQDDRAFWTIIGTDQALHHLTDFAIAIVLTAHV